MNINQIKSIESSREQVEHLMWKSPSMLSSSEAPFRSHERFMINLWNIKLYCVFLCTIKCLYIFEVILSLKSDLNNGRKRSGFKMNSLSNWSNASSGLHELYTIISRNIGTFPCSLTSSRWRKSHPWGLCVTHTLSLHVNILQNIQPHRVHFPSDSPFQAWQNQTFLNIAQKYKCHYYPHVVSNPATVFFFSCGEM